MVWYDGRGRFFQIRDEELKYLVCRSIVQVYSVIWSEVIENDFYLTGEEHGILIVQSICTFIRPFVQSVYTGHWVTISETLMYFIQNIEDFSESWSKHNL